jgi:hypothetical protein
MQRTMSDYRDLNRIKYTPERVSEIVAYLRKGRLPDRLRSSKSRLRFSRRFDWFWVKRVSRGGDEDDVKEEGDDDDVQEEGEDERSYHEEDVPSDDQA